MNETKTRYQKMITELTGRHAGDSRAAPLQEFSDITPDALEALLEAWPGIKLDRKRTLLEGLQSLQRDRYAGLLR